MVRREEIESFVRQVVRRFRPGAVVLFGSHAYGTPGEDSDVDLLVVMPYRGSSARAATRIRLACPRSFPMDLLVRSPVEIRRGLRGGDSFLREIVTRGITLHEAGNATVGR